MIRAAIQAEGTPSRLYSALVDARLVDANMCREAEKSDNHESQDEIAMAEQEVKLSSMTILKYLNRRYAW